MDGGLLAPLGLSVSIIRLLISAIILSVVVLGCERAATIDVQINKDSVTVWSDNGTSATVPMENITIHGIENLPSPTPVATGVVVPTPIPTPARTAVQQPVDATGTWGKEDMLNLLLTLNSDPEGTRQQYEGKRVSIQGPFKGPWGERYDNNVDLYWRYGEPIKRSFTVECRSDNPDLNQIARLDAMKESNPLITVEGGIQKHYLNRRALSVRNGGLSFTVYLSDCRVTSIGDPTVSE